jgi:hypothetical protein
MNVEWVVRHRLGLLDSETLVESEAAWGDLEQAGFGSIVTIRDCDDAFLWRLGNTSLRHYKYTFSDYPCPDARDLHDLNAYCLYELAHGRRVAIWAEDEEVRRVIVDSLEVFFAPGAQDVEGFIADAMCSQRERVLALPAIAKISRCRFCEARGCMTDLLCHGTDAETAAHIIRSGRILSARRIRAESTEVLVSEPRNAAADPADYFDYVMFAAGNCPGPDKLVYERMCGYVPSWDDFAADFQPAVKFFFRTVDLVNHPGFCADGYHPAKIRDELALEPLLLAVIIPRELPGAVGLVALAEEKLSASRVAAFGFSGCDPKKWAQMIYESVASSLSNPAALEKDECGMGNDES